MNYAGKVRSGTSSSEERREDAMREKLAGLGLYEEGMSNKNMRELLHAVDESITSAEGMSRENSTSSMNAVDASFPELPSIRQRPDSEKSPKKESPDVQDPPKDPKYISSPSPPRANLPSVTSLTQKNFPVLQTEMWRIDPLGSKTVDIPMKPRRPPIPPPKIEIIDGKPQIPPELKRLVGLKLDEAHAAHFKNKPNDLREKVKWGKPIQVCTGVWNFSLDKDDPPESPSKTSSDVYAYSGSDDESAFAHKDPKPSPPAAPIQCVRRTRQNVSRPLVSDSPDSNSPNLEMDPIREPKPGASRKRTVRKRETDYQDTSRVVHESSPEFDPPEPQVTPPPDEEIDVNTYPRRIIPPNPSKPRGPRGRKSGSKMENAANLMTDDEDDSPIFVSERTSRRVANASAMPEQAKKTEAESEREELERERSLRDQQNRTREERLQKWLREEQVPRKARENETTPERQRRDRYMSGKNVKLGRDNARVELQGDTSRSVPSLLNRDRKIRATPSAEDIDMFPADTAEDQVECPICNKYFPAGPEIEAHADICVETLGEPDVVPRTPSPGDFECFKCNKFRTYDGHKFEEHTTRCLTSNDQQASGSQTGPLEVPDSPTSFKTVSSLKAKTPLKAQPKRRNRPL